MSLRYIFPNTLPERLRLSRTSLLRGSSLRRYIPLTYVRLHKLRILTIKYKTNRNSLTLQTYNYDIIVNLTPGCSARLAARGGEWPAHPLSLALPKAILHNVNYITAPPVPNSCHIIYIMQNSRYSPPLAARRAGCNCIAYLFLGRRTILFFQLMFSRRPLATLIVAGSDYLVSV